MEHLLHAKVGLQELDRNKTLYKHPDNSSMSPLFPAVVYKMYLSPRKTFCSAIHPIS